MTSLLRGVPDVNYVAKNLYLSYSIRVNLYSRYIANDVFIIELDVSIMVIITDRDFYQTRAIFT